MKIYFHTFWLFHAVENVWSCASFYPVHININVFGDSHQALQQTQQLYALVLIRLFTEAPLTALKETYTRRSFKITRDVFR